MRNRVSLRLQEKVPFLPGMCAVLSRAHFNAFGAHFVHFAITSHFCTCSVHFYVWTCHLHSSSFNFVRQHSNGFTRLRRISHAQFMIRSFIYIRAHWNKHTFCAYQSVRLTATFVCIWRRHTFMRAFLAVYIGMCIFVSVYLLRRSYPDYFQQIATALPALLETPACSHLNTPAPSVHGEASH